MGQWERIKREWNKRYKKLGEGLPCLLWLKKDQTHHLIIKSVEIFIEVLLRVYFITQ